MFAVPQSAIPWMLLLALAGTFAGCRPSDPGPVPVHGTVTLDGQPLDGATIGFSPEGKGQAATGTTDASGRFSLTTFTPGDGAIPGRHIVTVLKIQASDRQVDMAAVRPDGETAPPPGPTTAGTIKIELTIPPKYANPKTSGFVVDVKPGMEPVRLELTSK